MTHAEALGLAQSGAKVLQDKAADLAGRHAIPVHVVPALTDGQGTTIGAPSWQAIHGSLSTALAQ